MKLEGHQLDVFIELCLRHVIDNGCAGLPSLGRAHDRVSEAIAKMERRLRAEDSSSWKQIFAKEVIDPEWWRAASSVMHDPTECPAFTADDMSEEWRKIWRPEDFNGEA
eukprot:8791357-Pyramimonas_sp.AAC.1